MNILQIISDTKELLSKTTDQNDLYGTFFIPKQNGYREINAPCKELKILQKAFAQYITRFHAGKNRRKISHSSAHGFIKGKGIITNSAEHLETLTNRVMHVNNAYKRGDTKTKIVITQLRKSLYAKPLQKNQRSVLVKFDIKNAFGSVKTTKVRQIIQHIFDATIDLDRDYISYSDGISLKELVAYEKEAVETLTQLVTLNGSLPQGAPSSPVLLNISLFKFQYDVTRKLKEENILRRFCNPERVQKIVVSTYADDISISFLLLKDVIQIPQIKKCYIDKHKIACFIERELKKHDFKLNLKKTMLFTKKRGFKITGITLSNSGLTVSRKIYANLRATIYNYLKDTFKLNKESKATTLEFERIEGMISHIASVDIAKADRLIRYFVNKSKKVRIDYTLDNGEYGNTLLLENTARLKELIQNVPYQDINTLSKLKVIR